MAQSESELKILKRFVISEGELPSYEEAGRQFGYGVEVTERAGDEYDVIIPPSIQLAGYIPDVVSLLIDRVPAEIMKFRVHEGQVRIAVIALKGQQDSNPFMKLSAALIEQSSVR